MREEDFPLGSSSDATIPLSFKYLGSGIVTNICSVSAPFPFLQQLDDDGDSLYLSRYHLHCSHFTGSLLCRTIVWGVYLWQHLRVVLKSAHVMALYSHGPESLSALCSDRR